jgi:hypothetical protein
MNRLGALLVRTLQYKERILLQDPLMTGGMVMRVALVLAVCLLLAFAGPRL